MTENLLQLHDRLEQFQRKRDVAYTAEYFDPKTIERMGFDWLNPEDSSQNRIVEAYIQGWLSDRAQKMFPGLDEIELGPNWIIKSFNHKQNAVHQKISIQQLQEWIIDQKSQLEVK